MTSTNERVGGVSKEVDYQKLGPALLIAPVSCWLSVLLVGLLPTVTASPK